MILMIDNFDSFTYNLVQYLIELGYEVKVYRNNAITINEIIDLNPTHVVLSPGPGRPENAGITKKVIQELKGEFPILGVCLGHQSIGECFGGRIVSAKKIMHGKISKIKHNNEGLFKGLPTDLNATRYHSLAIERETFPNEALKITAESDDGEIMGVEHLRYPIFGVQFHPESILSEYGYELLSNFLHIK